MADSPPPPKLKIKTVTDWINRPRQERADVSEQRRNLWDALAQFIHSQGAWLVSAPAAKILRIECRQGSDLASKLTAAGFSPMHCGTGTRIASGGTVETFTERGKQTTRLHDGIVPVDIIEITLGK